MKIALTPKEIQETYGLNIGTLGNMRFQKIGPKYYKLGRKIIYRVEDIENWISQNMVLTRDQAAR
jgi:hypothetical protein